jgi:preprotein translocase subunit YajC
MFNEFVIFIINLCVCLLYCFRVIRHQRREIKRLQERVKELEGAIAYVTM